MPNLKSNTSIVKKLNLLILLILCSWTLSYAQTGKDTIRCYNSIELRQIATGLIKGREYKEQLNLCEDEVEILKTIADKQYLQLINKDSIISMQEDQILLIKSYNDELQEKLSVSDKKLNRTKIKFSIITILLAASTGYFLFN